MTASQAAEAGRLGQEAARNEVLEMLRLRSRQLVLGTDPARGFIQAEGAGGVHIEQALGRTIARSPNVAADFMDPVLGPVSLKGPIPASGSPEGLANAALKDVRFNSATNAVFVDLTGLSPADAAAVKATVNAGTTGASKSVILLE